MAKKNQTSVQTSQNEKNVRCTWSTNDDSILVRVLREQKDAGNQSGAGWKKQVWHLVAEALKAESTAKGAQKVANKCADHWTNLKKNFLEVSAIRYASGFGWDEGTKTCTATDAVWAKYIEAHPTAGRWRSSPFPLFDDISYLVNGIVATGEGAFHPGRSISPTMTASSDIPVSSEIGNTSTVSGSSRSLLQDSVSEEIADDSDDPKEGSDPASSSKRRTRASSDVSDSHETPSRGSEKKKKGKRRRTTLTTQMEDRDAKLASAIFSLSKSMTHGSSMATPERREKAIDLLSKDEAFSEDDEGDLLTLFAQQVAYADTYMATKKKETRVKYGQKLLAQRRRDLL